MDPAADAAYLSPGSDAEPALEADTQPGPTLTTEAEGEREAEPIADIGADLSAVGASDPADAEPAQDAEIAFPSPDDLNRAPEREIQTPIADGDAEVATAPRRDRKRRMEKANEDAMSRLMRHADDEMAGAESRRRLSAIAHLKAAVAATEAERMVTGEAMSDPVAKAEPYREDLAHAVQPLTQTPAKLAADLDTGASLTARPRRTVSSKRPLLSQDDLPRPGTLRLSGMFPPPLVLVSAQRIDQPFPSGQPPVGQRSGRLTGVIGASAVQHDGLSAANENRFAADTDDEDANDADNIFSDDAGFAEFAEKLGAVSLTELMEAAAAFTTCVENRDHFTRPQLTRRLKVTNAGEPINREDGLRSFGTLLRSGRILKVRSGHYRLSPSSPYLIDARRYAQ